MARQRIANMASKVRMLSQLLPLMAVVAFTFYMFHLSSQNTMAFHAIQGQSKRVDELVTALRGSGHPFTKPGSDKKSSGMFQESTLNTLKEVNASLSQLRADIFVLNRNMLVGFFNKLKLPEIRQGSDDAALREADPFTVAMNSAEKLIVIDLLNILHQICSHYKITYFLYAGSLLGSYRHHDLIPWDDDIDILVNKSDKHRFKDILNKLSPEYELTTAGPRMKFYSKNSTEIDDYDWKWPYIDVSFFAENSTHLWDSSWDFPGYVYRKSIVFPLHLRPLAGLQLYAPYDTYLFLRRTYSSRDCELPYYSHRYERGFRYVNEEFSCTDVMHLYPFVHRFPARRGVKETLKLGNRTIHSMVVREPNYAITKTHLLQLKPIKRWKHHFHANQKV